MPLFWDIHYQTLSVILEVTWHMFLCRLSEAAIFARERPATLVWLNRFSTLDFNQAV